MRPYSRLAYVLAASLPVGIAASSAASAEPPSLTSVRAFDSRDAMVIPGPGAPGPGAEGRGLRGRDAHMLGTHGAFGRLSRGSAGVAAGARTDDPCSPTTPTPQLIEMHDTLESLDPMQPLDGQFSSPMWVNHPVSDGTLNRWAGQGAPFSSVSDEVLGDNDTRKVRLFANFSPSSGFYFGWRTVLIRENTGPSEFTRLVLRPDASQPLRGGHESWINSTDSTWSSETVSTSSGFISTRLLWGGTNTNPDSSLPLGPIDHYYWLGPPGGPLFTQTKFIGSAPAGFNVGDPVPVVVGAWHRLIHEFDSDNTIRYYIDYLDGQGEFLIGEHAILTTPYLDSVGGNATFEIQGETHYVDNVFAIGYERLLTPPPLACCGGSYTDDIEWLETGLLSAQSPRWTDALSSKASVVQSGGNKWIRQRNIFFDYFFREEFRTSLPPTHAIPGMPFTLCVDAHVSSNNRVIRGVSARATHSSVIGADNLAFRHFIGHSDPNDPGNPFYTPSLYTQINPAFDYTPVGTNPFENIAEVGVDIIEIGPFPSGGAFKTVCTEIDDHHNMIVTVDGVPYGAGLAAFRTGVVRMGFESRNDSGGFNDELRIDNVVLMCEPLPLVTYPNLTLVYLDDLEWAIPNVPPGAQVEDPAAPTRWSSASHVAVRDLGASTRVIEMENVRRDTDAATPGGPGFAFFTQASTELPEVEGSDTRGWVAGGRFMMTDGATTRVWSPSGQDPSSSTLLIVTRLVFSSVTQTFWVLVPHPDDDPDAVPPVVHEPIYIDTGAGLAEAGVGFHEWFRLTIHQNLDGGITFRVNGRLLRDASDAVVFARSLRSVDDANTVRTHSDLRRLSFSSGDEAAAPTGSILYADDVTAWALPCVGDATGDGFVGFGDLSIVLGVFGQSGQDLPGNIAPDADGDGVPDDDVVNFEDLNAVLSGYGAECD
ncbi:MAG: hypothetical protein EA379_01665 [Phycisphaerales bacterium]|nr:MAG: hypothetical protein EA379_01665 [Phycisphaerales bacterium]